MDVAAVSLEGQSRAGDYRKALAHSARVRRLKILLPIAALAISMAFVTVSWVRSLIPDNLEIAGARIEGGKIVMEKPAISGRNDDGISYFMNARRALQDITNPNDFTLEDIEAAVPVRGDLIARIKATSAQYDRSTDDLVLTDPFTVSLSSGLKAEFRSAHLDVHGGTLTSSDPIAVTYKNMSMVANSLDITDKGRVIRFSGKIKMVVEPSVIRQKSQ